MAEGWIKLHRKILDNQLWICEKFTRGQAWVDLILLANHEYGFFYKRGIKIELQRGQVGWSELALSARWMWSRTKLRKFLKELEKEQQIIQHKSKVTQVITIINYNSYQINDTTNKTTKEQQKDTNKNNKEEKEIKYIFNQFWDEYHEITKKPKTDKVAAFKHWKRLIGKEREKAIENIKPYYDSINDKKYCKKARTYLSDKNFNDEFRAKNGVHTVIKPRTADDIIKADEEQARKYSKS